MKQKLHIPYFTRRNHPPYLFLLLLGALLLFLIPASAATAGVITVNSLHDTSEAGDGFCTLREAIHNANQNADLTAGDCAAGSGADTILLPAGSYGLTNYVEGPLTITDDLTIVGESAESTLIDASELYDRIITVSADLTIDGVTLTGGTVEGNGGAIRLNAGTLWLKNSVVTQNLAYGNGGGIYLDGYLAALNVENSTISDNQATGQGGGVANSGGSVTIADSALSGNSASVGGGGLHNTADGYAFIERSAITGNVAGSGVFSSNKFGGGLKNEGAETYLQVINSTISGNSAADDGAGLYNNTASVDLINVTITNNAAISDGGGIDNFGFVNVVNSIVAGNSAGASAPDCRSLFGWPLVSGGNNLFGDGTGCPAGENDLTVTPTAVFTTVLGPLQNNGGPTDTHALLPGSPAIDAANSADCPATDQRGVARPQLAACDIGAYEEGDLLQTGPDFIVTTTADSDDGACTLSDCSLREAINAANGRIGLDNIYFDVPETYAVEIFPNSPLPIITDPIVIDPWAGEIDLLLDGANLESAAPGLAMAGGGSTLRGLTIQNFPGPGILLDGSGGNLVEYTAITGNGGDGIRVLGGSGNTLSANHIANNGGLGINLGSDGPTPNDAGDLDTGPNDLTNFPVIIRATPSEGGVRVEGVLNALPETTYTLEFFENSACDASGFGEGEYFRNSATVTTASNGSASFEILLGNEFEGEGPLAYNLADAAFTATATDSSGSTSEFSRCAPLSPGNDSWPNALLLPLTQDPVSSDLFTASTSQFIDQEGQSRWFKFQVQPNSNLIVTLTNLPANYDLTVYKDIGAAYEALLNVDDTDDLLRLSAEFAPDAFSPDAFSPDAFSPDAFSPDAFSPDAFSPDAFSPDIFSPDAFSPDAFSPDAFSPDAFSPDAFSPDAFSPDAFSPDAFSPDAFSPDAFSPDAFSSAQTQSLLAVSAYNGTAGEGVQLNTWENEGTFYVRVRGRNGAFSLDAPFQLDVALMTGNCSDITSVLPARSHTAVSGSYNSIILIDAGRMSGDLTEMQTRLAALAARPEVNGVIVDVGTDARVAAANAQSDANPACPFAKNLVAYSIKSIVDAYRSLNPLQYIVIIGNDDAIPFFRHPDQALLANERNYVPPVRDSTTSQASLKLGYILGQDRYGTALEISSGPDRLPIPDLAVGRLVETPSDIVTMLDAYLATANGVVSPGSALVTGYDFLEDASITVTAELEAGTGATADTLIMDRTLPPTDPSAWTADDLRRTLLTNRYDVTFLAGHFSAGSALAADYQTRLLASELAASMVDMTNSLIFSAGCHSGYNIVNEHGVPGISAEPDWAQAFAQKGATFIGGTGYQYGDTDFIEYSERLYLEFSRKLREGSGPVSVGEALVAAKQVYLADTPELRPLHEKALIISTLFGLPMLQIDMPTGRITPPADSSIVTETTSFAVNPGSTLGLSYADVTIDSALTTNQVTLNVVTNGAFTDTITATYLSGSDGAVTNPAEPKLPLERNNVTVPGQVLRGVGFRGGAYSDVGGILPLTGAATTEIRGVHPPFYTDTFYPVRPFRINYFDALINGAAGATRLSVTPAQYVSDGPASPTGTLRQYDDMDLRLYYSSYTTTSAVSGNAPALAAPPAIVKVTTEVEDGVVFFRARVVGDPAAGIQEVWVTYTADSGPYAGQWQSLDLTRSPNDSTAWDGSLPLNGAPTLYFMVQATNGVGLVSANTNLGAYFRVTADGPAEPPTPEATTLELLSPPTSGAFSALITVSAQLSSGGQPLAGQPVVFRLGGQQRLGVTNGSGVAAVTIPLLNLPGSDTLRAGFAGSDFYLPSEDSAPFTITPQGTTLTIAPNPATAVAGANTPVVAALTDAAGRPLTEKSIVFIVSGPNGSFALAGITDFAGRAFLGTTPLPAGEYTITAYFANVVPLPGGSINLTDPRYLPATATGDLTLTDPAPVVYISASEAGSVTGVNFGSEDILAYNLGTETWSLFLDGSDIGLGAVNLAAFEFLNNTILMSFDKTVTLAGVGSVSRNDIVRFIPTSLGEETAGSFEIVLRGSKVGLNSSAESIDAIGFTPDGRLLISTVRSFNVPGLNGKGSDLIVLNDAVFGEESGGVWEMYLEGSDVGLGPQANENIAGLWVDQATGDIYLTTERAFFVNQNFLGTPFDIFICRPTSLGADSACEFEFFLRGSDIGLTIPINGISIR